jgi:hypothetical protein
MMTDKGTAGGPLRMPMSYGYLASVLEHPRDTHRGGFSYLPSELQDS